MSARSFQLMFDSGGHHDPPTRYFGSLQSAYAALETMPWEWQRFAWVMEIRPGEKNIVYVRDGTRMFEGQR